MNSDGAIDALLLDYAAGALDGAKLLLAEQHCALSGRAALRALETVGGVMIETLDPDVPSPRLAPQPQRRTADPRSMTAARALIASARVAPDSLRWQWRAPALRELRLPVENASLIRLAAGSGAPRHDHTHDEWTLVLQGAFHDATGAYQVGDLAFASEGHEHTPRVDGPADCICLIAFEGRWRFRSLAAKVAAALLH